MRGRGNYDRHRAEHIRVFSLRDPVARGARGVRFLSLSVGKVIEEVMHFVLFVELHYPR